jgi:DNA-binding NtrC family response regulator
MRANILVLGLEDPLGTNLSRALAELRYHVASEPYVSPADGIGAIDRNAAGIVFCTAETSVFEGLVDALRARGRQVPVVAVSRCADVAKWLDAMDAGATDYCAPPFEPGLLRNIVENSLAFPRRLAPAC